MNLELAETEELITELLGRFQHAVFAGLKIRKAAPDVILDEKSEGQEQFESIRWVGGSRTCQGLACAIVGNIDVNVRSRMEEADDGW